MRPSQYHYTPVEFKISAHFLCTHLHVEANKNGEQIRKCANWDPCSLSLYSFTRGGQQERGANQEVCKLGSLQIKKSTQANQEMCKLG